jgi:hypothetical protein
MSADDFFSRWSRGKAATPAEPDASAAPSSAVPPPPATDLPPPTLEDVAALGHDADFTRFVKPGVDETVRRSAMKKLFTDPHFNVMDGLDIYIGDYNTFEPLPPAMLAMLLHAKPLLDPLGHLQQPAMKMLDRLEKMADAVPAEGDAAQPDADADAEIAPAVPVPAADAPDAITPEPDGQLASVDQASGNSAVSHDDGSGNKTPAAEPPRNTASPEDDHTI